MIHPYRERRSYALALFIILLAVFISFSSLSNLFGIRSILISALYPFQFIAVSLWKGVLDTPTFIINLQNLARQNAQLENELNRLKAKLTLWEELISENERLRDALAFKQKNRYGFKLLAAQVIGRSPSPWFSILEIDQGSRAGVKKDMPVIVKEGLVGRIIEVSEFSSKVMLLKDAESSVAAADARSRDFGVVEGRGGDKLFMKYVSAGGDVKLGDKIVTSKISSIFPSGIPIGTVIQATKREHDLFYHIEIEPAVTFSKIEEVFIVF